ncbi:UNVERIFIED_CONTAM: hypothetical protein Sradi_2694800 [Sesamum radiatum]|uniref:Retrotransposon gag domain-containing protein n=1 Tax=Sesamum radiatum TaxID=300843 RepID=A0AAW2S6I2_SESRA
MADQTSLCNRVAELESQVQRMLEILGQAPESPPVALFPLVDTLHSRVETLQKTVGEWPEMLDKRVMSAIEEASILTDVRVDGVQAEVNLLKRVVGRDDDRAPMSKGISPKLKHAGTVRDYVKEFSSLMLDVRDMSEEDKLFNFLSGLQTWAQTELRRQGVKDLPSTIAAADRLVDFRVTNNSDPEKKKKDSGKEKGSPVRRGKMENLRKRSTRREQGLETRRSSSPTLTEQRRAVTSAMVTTACGTVLSEGN